MKEGITITHDSNSNQLILFIHGFTGSSDKTWKNGNDYLPKMIEEVPLIHDNYDIGVFEYYSSLSESKTLAKNIIRSVTSWLTSHVKTRHKNNSINEIKNLLNTQLIINENYTNIIYIAHSMGGLIAKSIIIDKCKENLKPKTKLFISLAVPHIGSNIANIGKILSPNSQIKDLSSLSESINNLNTDWSELSNKPHSIYFYGTNDLVVQKVSASSIDRRISEVVAVNADHETICKPTKDNDEVFRLIVKFIKDVTTFPNKKEKILSNKELHELKDSLITIENKDDSIIYDKASDHDKLIQWLRRYVTNKLETIIDEIIKEYSKKSNNIPKTKYDYKFFSDDIKALIRDISYTLAHNDESRIDSPIVNKKLRINSFDIILYKEVMNRIISSIHDKDIPNDSIKLFTYYSSLAIENIFN